MAKSWQEFLLNLDTLDITMTKAIKNALPLHNSYGRKNSTSL